MPRTIDDIVPPSRRRSVDAPSVPDESPVNYPPQPRVKIRVGKGFPYGTAIVAIIVIALSAGALYAFGGAKVQITPTSSQATVSGTFMASTDGTGDLPFKVVSVSKTETVSVPAESTQTANDPAQGTITVTNTLTTAEKFVTNTRFQSASGLMYRVHAAVTIPPATASGPGSVSVTVYADQPGQQYNLAATTFTVPGLQGSAAYHAVTAKSVDAFTGGFTGTRASVSLATDAKQQAALQSKLATDLQSAINTQIPQGYVIIHGGTFTSYNPLPDSATTTAQVNVSVQGTETAAVFPNDGLAKAVAYKAVGTYQGQPVTLTSTDGLTLTPGSTTPPTASDTTFGFNLSGNSMVMWTVDATKIAGAVAGKTRESAQSILQSFPEIAQATLILRPFWSQTFPQDPSHVQVVVQKPSGS
jgi:hypothetical protein